MMLTALLVASTATWAQTPADSTSTATDSIAWDKALDGVTVKAQRQLVKQSIDRITYDVAADEESRTANVLDVVRKMPMVSVDGEDNILVKGNGNYRIYRNGHPDPSLSRNASEVLKAMPASAVKRIEVITEPGAREDAEGVNAILNIVMMDARQIQGVTGSVSGTYTSLGAPQVNTYLAAQMGKAIVSVDYGYSYAAKKMQKNEGNVERTYVNTGNHEIGSSTNYSPGYIHFADVNASYDIDTLNLLSASFGGFFYNLNAYGDTETKMFDAENHLLYAYGAHSRLPQFSHHSWHGRLDYEHKTRRQGEQFTASYMFAMTRQRTDDETFYTSLTDDMPFDYAGVLQSTRERFTEHTFQADYLRPLWKGHRVETGAKYILRSNGSNNEQAFYASILPTTFTTFDHTMNIAAAYVDYFYEEGRWSARAGLRYEHSYMKGHYPDGSAADFDKRLNDWVPQASLKYQFNDRQSLKLGYVTSITRPGITFLNPAVVSLPQQVSYGNAHLSSERHQSLTLMYSYFGQRLTLQLAPAMSYTHNGLGAIVYAVDDVRYSTFSNVLRQYRWQMEGYAQWKPIDGTTLVANVTFTDNHARHSGLRQHTTSAFYYVSLAQQLPWKLLGTMYTFGQAGRSPQTVYAYTQPWNRYAISLQRSFLRNERLTLRLHANSPFHVRQHYKTRTTLGDVRGWGDAVNRSNGRYFALTATFRFGNLQTAVKKTSRTIENSDVVGGISKGN